MEPRAVDHYGWQLSGRYWKDCHFKLTDSSRCWAMWRLVRIWPAWLIVDVRRVCPVSPSALMTGDGAMTRLSTSPPTVTWLSAMSPDYVTWPCHTAQWLGHYTLQVLLKAGRLSRRQSLSLNNRGPKCHGQWPRTLIRFLCCSKLTLNDPFVVGLWRRDFVLLE